MNDVSGIWIPPWDEDGNGAGAALPLLITNVMQRIREWHTWREDWQLEIPVADALKRLIVEVS
jgi:hypothetical protein